MRQEVKEFANIMEQVLKDNDDKSHWNNETLHQLESKLRQRLAKLTDAVCRNDLQKINKETTNIANYVMMIRDNAKKQLTKR